MYDLLSLLLSFHFFFFFFFFVPSCYASTVRWSAPNWITDPLCTDRPVGRFWSNWIRSTIRACVSRWGLFAHVSPAQSLYVEAHEPSLTSRRVKLSLNNVLRLKSLPENPAYSYVFLVLSSPWYNGWLGIKHQVTYLLTPYFTYWLTPSFVLVLLSCHSSSCFFWVSSPSYFFCFYFGFVHLLCTVKL